MLLVLRLLELELALSPPVSVACCVQPVSAIMIALTTAIEIPAARPRVRVCVLIRYSLVLRYPSWISRA